MASRAATGRITALIVAVALALGGAYLIWNYVQRADARAREGTELVDVFVAAGGIPEGMLAGTAVSQQLIETDQVPSQNVPDGALTSLEQISGLAASAPILPGEILLAPRWGDPTLATSNFDVPPDRVAMSLQVAVPQGVSGFLAAGDRVGIIGHLDVAPTTPTIIGPDGNVIFQPDEEATGTTTQSRFLAPDVEVLAVGRRVVSANGSDQPTAQIEQTEQVLLTVAVTADEAEKLAFASNEGQLYLTLLPTDGSIPQTSGRTAENLFES